MATIKEEYNGVEIEPFIYSKTGSWKLYLLAYKEAREMMIHIREHEIVELDKTLFDNPELANDDGFLDGYNSTKSELRKEQASLDWVNQKISELPQYDPFL